ncbi:MAG TPA: 7-carboxy-7-deazaguanine synthase QueE [Polyangiaceae bacterium]|nr:7-carboxy-7-deazaguanine synthase QueE [Polyangiaceae bacterium]
MKRAVSATTLWLSERFVSLQGEGVSMGAPSAFVRLGRCNLACGFCDTPYTWDFERYVFDDEISAIEADELCAWLLENSPGRIIWTGGEPLIQQKQMVEVIRRLDASREAAGAERDVLEVETNGTVRPHPELLERIDQWNVSPKLAGSGETVERRLVDRALGVFADSPRARFKFVLSDEADEREALELSDRLKLARDRVIFMPEARDASELRERSPWVAAAALRARVRFSGRLHLELYGGRRGT